MFSRLRATLWDCYYYREVLFNILSRDLKVKYKRTFLGYFWSLLNPVLQLAVMTAVFSHVVRLDMKDYTLFLFSGLLAWSFFHSSLIMASFSFLENENFIKKVYLPKLIFPLSKLCLRLIDFALSLFALSVIGLVMGFAFKATVLWLPVAILLFFLFTLGLSLFGAVAEVYFRDVQYLLSVFLQLLYFATPILYPVTVLPERYQAFMRLNPLFSQVTIFQRLIYDGRMPSEAEWLAAVGTALGSLVLGFGVLLLREEDLVFRM